MRTASVDAETASSSKLAHGCGIDRRRIRRRFGSCRTATQFDHRSPPALANAWAAWRARPVARREAVGAARRARRASRSASAIGCRLRRRARVPPRQSAPAARPAPRAAASCAATPTAFLAPHRRVSSSTDFCGSRSAIASLHPSGREQPQHSDLVDQLRCRHRRQPLAEVLVAVDRGADLSERRSAAACGSEGSVSTRAGKASGGRNLAPAAAMPTANSSADRSAWSGTSAAVRHSPGQLYSDHGSDGAESNACS